MILFIIYACLYIGVPAAGLAVLWPVVWLTLDLSFGAWMEAGMVATGIFYVLQVMWSLTSGPTKVYKPAVAYDAFWKLPQVDEPTPYWECPR
jgi:hypothetical protein